MLKRLILSLYTILAFISLNGQGYVQDYNSMGVSMGIINHHAAVLDNRENATSFLSHFAKLNYNKSISPLFNFHQQLGMGYYQNASIAEPFWTKSQVYNYSLGISLNVPKFFVRTYHSKVSPYAHFGYQFAYHIKTSVSRHTSIVSDFLVGGGVSYQINDYFSIYTQLNIGQRLGLDFQTTLQTQIGVNATLIK